jgi:hypothetical protein
MFEMLLRRKDPLQAREIGAIIISPTRYATQLLHLSDVFSELATQISRVVSTFTEQLKFTSLLLIGGTGMQEGTILESLVLIVVMRSRIVAETWGADLDWYSRTNAVLFGRGF